MKLNMEHIFIIGLSSRKLFQYTLWPSSCWSLDVFILFAYKLSFPIIWEIHYVLKKYEKVRSYKNKNDPQCQIMRHHVEMQFLLVYFHAHTHMLFLLKQNWIHTLHVLFILSHLTFYDEHFSYYKILSKNIIDGYIVVFFFNWVYWGNIG